MDEIDKRLRDTADTCIKVYETWAGNKKDLDAREKLQEAIHELRKVAARLEIEIATSERDQMASRPLPIPPHRSSRRRDNGPEDDDNAGNMAEGHQGGGNRQSHNQGGGNGQPGGQGAPRRQLGRRSQQQGGGGAAPVPPREGGDE
ncbi:hypothetical protein [Micavibrio aeruginosavorus]|uniref:Uncharacterized protein n=1 Tax=Micavibrio aeruginosavorus EPB TaxID=349215 RepID=M4VGP8_9BACT|nr:hypothetical protein [Micavibrio aeruginosavorus]AGH98388.1 hypothetical protein A11S_1584 [Micavibrio aeruginosavorus EPB]